MSMMLPIHAVNDVDYPKLLYLIHHSKIVGLKWKVNNTVKYGKVTSIK